MTTRVLILGAAGAIAQHVIDFIIENKSIELTLFARDAKQLSNYKNKAKIIQGDVLNQKQLNNAIVDKDIVYANLAGAVDKMASQIIKSMETNDVKRLLFVTSLGIYNEVPGKFGEWNNRMIGSVLKTYSKAAEIIEESNLDYTIIRPAWLQDEDEIDYETTHKPQPFKGTEVSRKSVGAYIADIIHHSTKDVKASIGVNKPNTNGDKPSFY